MAEANSMQGTEVDNPSASVPVPMDSTSAVGEPEMRMFQKIIASGRTIKSQQRGESDFSESQKIEILSSILHRTPGAFLMRFGPELDGTDLLYFDGSKDFEVVFRVEELRRNLDSRVRETRVRNRRYECIKELTEKTEYFSEEEMRDRNPLLYEHYIGQYLTQEEKAARDSNKSEMSLSAMIMGKMNIDRRRELFTRQREQEAEQLEETDSSSEEEDDAPKTSGNSSAMELSRGPEIADPEKRMMRQEFLRAMQLNFLSGKDKDFDYGKVDASDRYDSLELRGQDEEEAYFDEEKPSWCQGDGMDSGSGGMETRRDDHEVHYYSYDVDESLER